MFKHLDAVLLKPSVVQKDRATCVSTVVVNRNYKKADIAIEWVLVRAQGGWKVVDTLMLGESTAEGIREDQLEPLLQQGGMENVLKAMRKRAAELAKASHK
jgi:ABC-type transporter MlaC component